MQSDWASLGVVRQRPDVTVMKCTYDGDADALYVKIEALPIDHQVEMPDGVIVDVSSDGRIVGIDVMNPASGWNCDPILELAPLSDETAALLRQVSQGSSVPPEIT